MDPSSGSVRSTPLRALVVSALFGGLSAWALVTAVQALDLIPPSVPWSAPIGLALIAALVGALAYTTHQRLQVRRERMDAQRAVTLLVLGKASALAGALVGGGYLAYALLFVSRLDVPGPRERVVHSAVATVAGIALCLAGLLLERACRVPGGGDEDTDEGSLGSDTPATP